MCAVATQGDINGNEWVTDFKLSFSTDGSNWITYKDGNGIDVVSFGLIVTMLMANRYCPTLSRAP